MSLVTLIHKQYPTDIIPNKPIFLVNASINIFFIIHSRHTFFYMEKVYYSDSYILYKSISMKYNNTIIALKIMKHMHRHTLEYETRTWQQNYKYCNMSMHFK